MLAYHILFAVIPSLLLSILISLAFLLFLICQLEFSLCHPAYACISHAFRSHSISLAFYLNFSCFLFVFNLSASILSATLPEYTCLLLAFHSHSISLAFCLNFSCFLLFLICQLEFSLCHPAYTCIAHAFRSHLHTLSCFLS
jgi:hypothetical protein